MQLLDNGVKGRDVIGGELRGAREDTADGWVELLQEWQHIQSHAIPRIGPGLIGGVFNNAQSDRGAVGESGRPLDT